MAKVTTPLQSYSARGQIGKSMVHFVWKGIHCIRSYVIPTNPNTAKQQTIREYFRDSVAKWHTDQQVTVMNEAWKRWIERIRKPWTPLNCFCSLRVAALAVGHTFARIYDYVLGTVTASSIKFTIVAASTDALKCYFGTSLTYTPREQAGTWNSVEALWDFTLAGLTPNTNYYYWIKATKTNDDGQTGMFKTKTAGG